jgi:hypothetical protein
MTGGSSSSQTNSSQNSKSISNNYTQTKQNNNFESNEFYPHTEFLLFEQMNIEAIFKKLREFQEKLATTHHSETLISDRNNVELIEHLMQNYEKLNVSSQLNDQIDLLFQMINAWPKGEKLKLLNNNKKLKISLI